MPNRQSASHAVQSASAMGRITTARDLRRRQKRIVLGTLATCALAFLAGELALRALTTITSLGVVAVGRVVLVPWRPTPGTVRAWQERRASDSYMVPDPELGWSLKPSSRTLSPEPPVYTTNAQGFRADPDRVYAEKVPEGKLRLVCVGDSFTHGDEVGLADTWEARLEGLDARLEVVNLGVPAFGTDQALLRWRRDGRSLQAHAVVLGIWPENMCRNLNLIRFWFSPQSGFWAKPRFVPGAGGELRLVNSPVPQGVDLVTAVSDPANWPGIAHEKWYEPTLSYKYITDNSRVFRTLRGVLYARERQLARRRIYSGEDPEGIAITVGIARLFAAEVQATGAVPLVAIMPMRDLLDEWSGEDEFPLAVALEKAGLNVVDLFPAARAAGPGAFLPSGHLTPVGNAALAAELQKVLPRHVPALAPAR